MAIQSEHEATPRENTYAVRVRMNSNPHLIYESWTKGIDRWFAAPGSVRMEAKEGGAYSFETEHEGQRHPHHGKFLHLEKDRLVEMTWVTGEGGTEGAETVVSIEIAPGAQQHAPAGERPRQWTFFANLEELREEMERRLSASVACHPGLEEIDPIVPPIEIDSAPELRSWSLPPELFGLEPFPPGEPEPDR